MRSLFKFLFGLGTALVIFGLLFAQTKSTDHMPDLIIWSVATAALVGALGLMLGKRLRVAEVPVYLIVLVLELLFCGFALIGIVQHLHYL